VHPDLLFERSIIPLLVVFIDWKSTKRLLNIFTIVLDLNLYKLCVNILMMLRWLISAI